MNEKPHPAVMGGGHRLDRARTAALVRALRDIQNQFTAPARLAKRRLLAALNKREWTEAKGLRGYHDALLFLAAYPDNAALLRSVQSSLHTVARAVRRIVPAGPSRQADALAESGIAYTRLTCSFSIDIASWLAARCGNEIEIDWEDPSAGDSIDGILPLLVAAVERDGLLDERLGTRQWLRLARSRRGTDLAWITRQFAALNCPEEVRERLFDDLELDFRWVLRRRPTSRTFNRFPSRPITFQSAPLKKSIDLRSVLSGPIPRWRWLRGADAKRLLDTCRWALCARRREIDTLSYANPREVYVCRLERGIDVVVFGMRPVRRLPIESYFGFMVSKNRLPIGYGGGWVLGDRSEIGVNIFEEFRGGESAFAFGQVLRVFRHLFSVTRFAVDPFQFGDDNPEAIRSGAFWFYYRMGFRPTQRPLSALAEAEFSRMQVGRGSRTPPATLRRLARGTMEFNTDGADATAQDFGLTRLGTAMTRWIGRRFAGDRSAAQAFAARRAMKLLALRATLRWPAEEQESFNRLSVLIGPIHDLVTWTGLEKQRLIRLMRAKGGPLERLYVRLFQRHHRLRRALAGVARSAPRREGGRAPRR